MRIVLILLMTAQIIWGQAVRVDASSEAPYRLRKIFDAFRAAQNPAPGRLQQINSSLVRTFAGLTDKPYTGLYLFDVVRGQYPDFTYHFGFVDSEFVEPLINAGTQINLGYCYMPLALGDDPWGPPRNYEAWEEFNYNWAKHYNENYGIRYFEVWNEPDFSEFFKGSRDDYFKMYQYAVKGIRRAVPEARVGGPALAGNMGWIGPFLDFVIANSLPLNFISYHSQNNGYNDTKYYERYLSVVNELDNRGMDSVEVHLNEFSYDLDPSPGSSYDRSECAAWFAGTFKHILENMPRLARFNKTIVDNGQLASKWKYNGLITETNIPKAKFNFFRLYSMMPDTALVSQAEGAIDVLAGRADSTLSVLVWNKQSAGQNLQLTVDNLDFTIDSVNVYLIDPAHSSYFDDTTTSELEMVETLYPPDSSAFYTERQLREYSVVLYKLAGHKTQTGLDRISGPLPKKFRLHNYPNPFNPQTTIEFKSAGLQKFSLYIADNRGRMVRRFSADVVTKAAGRLRWDGRDGQGHLLPSGVYFAVARSDRGVVGSAKMVLLK